MKAIYLYDNNIESVEELYQMNIPLLKELIIS